jgi:hypothetical protein
LSTADKRKNNFEAHSAADRVLRPIFGKRWRWWALFLALLVISPSIVFGVFRHEVAFDPVHFVEEWTKLSITMLCVLLLFEILQEKRRVESKRHLLTDFTLLFIIGPLRDIQHALTDIRSRVAVGVNADFDEILDLSASEAVKVAVALESAVSLSDTLTARLLFARMADTLNINFIVSALRDLSRVREWGSVPLDDLERVRKSLEQGLAALHREFRLDNDLQGTHP